MSDPPVRCGRIDLYAEYRRDQNADKEQINDDIVFEIELVKQVEINVDYILILVQKYRDARGYGEDVEIRATISRAADSSPSLRNKKDLIEDFVDSVSATGEIDDEWRAYVAARREAELNEIIRPRTCAQTRLAPSSMRPSATVRSRRLVPGSPRCYRRSRGSRPAVDIARRSSAYWRSSGSSSSDSSD